MSLLPKIEAPIHTVKLPISGLQVRYRPYCVKEQKLLAMAKESDEKNALVDAILQLLTNCVLDSTNVSELPLTDVEYLFYMLRARSESEIVEMKFRCENSVDDGTCNNIMDYDLNLLTDLEVIKGDVSDLIEVTDKVGLKLKYQRFAHDTIGDKIPTPQDILEIIAKNVDYIYDENSAYGQNDVPLQNIVDWIGQLPPEKYKKIEEFFDNEPKIVKNVKIKCNKCGFDHVITVTDIFDFFI